VGMTQVSWDGRNESGDPVPAGMYFLRLEAGDGVRTGRFVLVP